MSATKWIEKNKEIEFYACRNLPVDFPLLDIHATGYLPCGAAVTAIAAALPS